MPVHVSDQDLREAVQAYYDCEGNKSEAARSLGLHRKTFTNRLDAAELRFKKKLGKVADGYKDRATAVQKRKLPARGKIKYYILTSIQNNTRLHGSWYNMLAYAEWLENLKRTSSVEVIAGTYSYQKARYGEKAVKRGSKVESDSNDLWYAPEALPYIQDVPVQLAPGLIWAGNFNALPTAKNPLSGLESFNGRASNIIPHSKMHMESVASMQDEATKFNYSTGTVTQKNYLQKRAGIVAEQEHIFGAVLVEVDSKGHWFVRMLEFGADESIMDVGPDGYSGITIRAGQVHEEHNVESIQWGDVHVAELDSWVRDLCWGEGGMLDTLQPKYQFMHDLFSMRSRSHHELRDFHATYAKHKDEVEEVEKEIEQCADFLHEADRSFCEMVVVPSNHDRHLEVWLNKTDCREDPVNAKFYCWLQYHKLDAIDNGNPDFSCLEFCMTELGAPKGIRFLSVDESFVILKKRGVSDGIEQGLHGDLGPNGSRGSTRNLAKMGRNIAKGHDHRATRYGNVMSAGSCMAPSSTSYAKGPSSWSISHIVTYKNGARSIITMFAGKWRA